MTTEQAKERLERYAGIKLEQNNRLRKLAQLQQKDITAPASYSRSEEYARQIAPVIQSNRREMAEIERAVSVLDDPLEREVLRLRYHCCPWETPCARLLSWKENALRLYDDTSEAAVYRAIRLHKKALTHLANVITKN